MKGTEANLLKVRYPELLKEIDPDPLKNTDIDLKTLSYSSHKVVSWICLKNEKHKYDVSVNNKTNLSIRGKGSGCKKCFHDTHRIHDEDEINAHRENFVSDISTIQTGDLSEIYFCKLLESMDYKNVINLGNIGATSDIHIITHEDKNYFIQVKTLTHTRGDDYYLTHDIGKYPDNMLIVMVNKERTRYAIEFAGNIKAKRMALPFNSKKSKYLNIMYTDLKIFKHKLKTLIPLSRTELEFSSNTIKKEYEMLNRLESFCNDNNMIYKRNLTNSQPWDGTINGHKLQAKYVSIPYETQLTYAISSKKCAGIFNGKATYRHYDVGDFEYAIVEIGGIKGDETKYHNNFCIIPAKVLIEQKVLKSKTCKGKKCFSICPPDYLRSHWSKPYWNIPEELKLIAT